MNNVERIAAVLEQHGTSPGPRCHCGYQYRPGESIPMHRAQAVDASLMLHDMGVSDADLIAATTASLKIAWPQRYERAA
jgi:hypothetical protein